MAEDKPVGLVFVAWDDFDRVLQGLSAEDATRQVDGGSSFAWTLAHVTNQIDSWINVRLLHHEPHPIFGQDQWRMGGNGTAEEWDAIREAVPEVRQIARTYLESVSDSDLDALAPYTGSLAALKGRMVTLRYTLLRISAHHYFHLGDIASVRSRRLGQQVGDYPSALMECL